MEYFFLLSTLPSASPVTFTLECVSLKSRWRIIKNRAVELKQERKSEVIEGRRQTHTIQDEKPGQVSTHVSHHLGQLGPPPPHSGSWHTGRWLCRSATVKGSPDWTSWKLKVSLYPSCLKNRKNQPFILEFSTFQITLIKKKQGDGAESAHTKA